MKTSGTPLLTDLYQLNMIQAYLDYGQDQMAVFEFFVRKFPRRRGFLVAAGLQHALEFLETVSFSAEEIDWLDQSGRFGQRLLQYLAKFRFTGEVYAMPEGTGALMEAGWSPRVSVFGISNMIPHGGIGTGRRAAGDRVLAEVLADARPPMGPLIALL